VSILILIYHGLTETGGGLGNLHSLPKRHFDAQIGFLKKHDRSVVSWRDLGSSTGAAGPVKVALSFDDGCKSDLESGRFLRSQGYDALFFIATEYIDKPGYLSRSEILELQRLGMGIGSHSHHHTPMAPLTDAQVVTELRTSKQVLEDLIEAPVHHFSFPGGSYDKRIIALGREQGYRYFHTSDWGVNRGRQSNSGVFRRTSVLNSVDEHAFEKLLQLRGYRMRQLAFHAKESTKRLLGEDRYYKLRLALLRMTR
jgi:peptidoglycan/xylan/chitin deacetylase (PgdA/CDA1 family)